MEYHGPYNSSFMDSGLSAHSLLILICYHMSTLASDATFAQTNPCSHIDNLISHFAVAMAA